MREKRRAAVKREVLMERSRILCWRRNSGLSKQSEVATLQSERGSALVLILIVCAVLLLFSATLMTIGTSENVQAKRQEDKQQAYYMARSGVDAVAAWIINNPSSVDQLLNKTSDPIEMAEGNVVITVNEGPDNEIIIQANSTTGNFHETASLTMVPGGQGQVNMTFENAVFSKTDIKLYGSAMIRGSAGINSREPGSIYFGWSTGVTGNLFVGPGADIKKVVTGARPDPMDNVNLEVLSLDHTKDIPLPEFPPLPSGLPWRGNFTAGWNPSPPYSITQDGEYGDLTVLSELRIDVGNGIRTIRVKNFEVSGSGKIILVGSGTLHLYVEDSFVVANGGKVNNGGDPNRLLLVYKGDSKVSVAGDTRVFANCYIERAALFMGGSNAIHGNIICGGLGQDISLDIEGDASAYARVLYAPNSNVSLKGSGKVRGAIVANSFTAEGGTWVEFSQDIANIVLPVPVIIEGQPSGFSRGIWK